MPPRVYRIAPALRRCCWYGIAALPVLAAVGALVTRHVNQRRLEDMIPGAVVTLLLGSCLAVPVLWRLRVDKRGLHRRLLGWNAFWPWEDFERGAIVKRLDGSLVHTEWPWWTPRRRFTLPLGSVDRREVIDTLNEHYRLPPTGEAPKSLGLWIGFTRIRLDRNGVHVGARRGEETFLWPEVEAVDIRRSDPKRHDFHRLELVLPGRVLDFRVLQGKAQWRGAKPDELVALLLTQVTPERVTTYHDAQPLPNRALVERRVADAEKSVREFRQMAVGFGCLVLAMLAAVAWGRGLQAAALLVVLQFGWVGVVLLSVRRGEHRHAAAWRALLDYDAWRTTPPPGHPFSSDNQRPSHAHDER